MDTAAQGTGFPSHISSQLQEASEQIKQGRGRGRGRGARRRARISGNAQGHDHASQNNDAFIQQPWSPDSQPRPFWSGNYPGSHPPSNTMDAFPPLGRPLQQSNIVQTMPSMAGATEMPSPIDLTTPSQMPGPGPGPGPGMPHKPPFAPQLAPTGSLQEQWQHLNDPNYVPPRPYVPNHIARGYHRGRGHRGHHQPPAQHPPAYQANFGSTNAYGRPAGQQGILYNPHNANNFQSAEVQRNMRHVIMKQSDYLQAVGREAHAELQLTRDESLKKEAFRLELQELARTALSAHWPELDTQEVRLRCYGSLANGFGLAGCDMDLLLHLPKLTKVQQQDSAPAQFAADNDVGADDGPAQDFDAKVQRVLEKAFLDHGFGARLLTKTRVPILKVCQSPGAELMSNLKANRAAWEKSSGSGTPPEEKESPGENMVPAVDSLTEKLAQVDMAKKWSPARGNSGLEFVGDCGIQCDVNFTNFVALHNTALLRTYHDFDRRVADVGTFVKIWAKQRDINTPYLGTLSSYGYILMVLHYLMNIASPPVIPNLQHHERVDDEWNEKTDIELFEGFDIRFVRDPAKIEEIRARMPKNNQSVGQLLRGFFEYYGTSRGFHWTQEVISIRTYGGIMSKKEKGWTEAKWDKTTTKQIRHRYLHAIEDPFEVNHNVARTVGHHGIVAIRDEFRRAWDLIQRVGQAEDIPVATFLENVKNRGDTLRQDTEFHRQKLKMKQEIEAREANLLQKGETEGIPQDDGTFKDARKGVPQNHSSNPRPGRISNSKLTSAPNIQANPKQKNQRRKTRQVLVDSDDEEQNTPETAAGLIVDNVADVKQAGSDCKTKDKRHDTNVKPVRAQQLLSMCEKNSSAIPTDVPAPAKDRGKKSLRYQHPDGTTKRPHEERVGILQVVPILTPHLDARQLKDLATIAQGGNGCARGKYMLEASFGYQFHEAVMKENQPESGRSEVSTPTHSNSYQPGQGDVEGLLNELPALSEY